jgi:hypothetical protein
VVSIHHSWLLVVTCRKVATSLEREPEPFAH